MADALVALLERRGQRAWWRPDVPGVWTAAGKVAAVGVDARGGVAMHGFAINVSVDLEQFQMIVPCGLQAPVTSLEALGAAGGQPRGTGELGALARELALDLSSRYGTEPQEVDARRLQRGLGGGGER
jgi:lipoate-protein ligase B